MLNQRLQIFNFSLISAITILFIVASIVSSTVFVLYFIGFLFTILSFKTLVKDKNEFGDTILIFGSTMLFGFLLAFMVSNDFLSNGVTFSYPDQMHFFEETIALASSNSLSELLNRAFVTDYTEYKVVYLIFGSLGYLDNVVSGSVQFLPLLYSVVYTTALIPVFLYHTIKLYTTQRNALLGSLFYALLTPIMAYSGYLLRDMHIALIMMIVLYLMTRELKLWRIVIIALLIPITYHIRGSNALLVLAMLGIYIFAGKSSKTIRLSFVVLGAGFLIYYGSNIMNLVSSIESRLEGYQYFTAMSAEESSNLGKYLYRFPPIIKEASIILFSLSAFPFIGSLFDTADFSQFGMILYNSATNIGWFFIFFGLIYFIKPYVIKVFRMKDKTFLYLSALFVLYMIMNVNNMTFRRLICTFPFVYIPFLLVYFDASKEKRKRYKTMTVFSGIGLYLIYFVLLNL